MGEANSFIYNICLALPITPDQVAAMADETRIFLPVSIPLGGPGEQVTMRGVGRVSAGRNAFSGSSARGLCVLSVLALVTERKIDTRG